MWNKSATHAKGSRVNLWNKISTEKWNAALPTVYPRFSECIRLDKNCASMRALTSTSGLNDSTCKMHKELLYVSKLSSARTPPSITFIIWDQQRMKKFANLSNRITSAAIDIWTRLEQQARSKCSQQLTSGELQARLLFNVASCEQEDTSPSPAVGTK